MRKYNLSAETIRCNCCTACKNEVEVDGSRSSSNNVNNGSNSDSHFTDSQPGVPELGYHMPKKNGNNPNIFADIIRETCNV